MAPKAKNMDGLIEVFLEYVGYVTGEGGTVWLSAAGSTSTGNGRFWSLIARNGDVIIKSTSTVHSGNTIPADITLSPGEAPIFGDFKNVIIDAGSAGILEVHARRPNL